MLKAVVIAFIFDLLAILVIYAINLPLNNIGAISIGVLSGIIGIVVSEFSDGYR